MGARVVLLCFLLTACEAAAPADEPPVVFARFDPTEGVIPRPNDILRGETHLEIPTEPADLEDKTAAEIALIHSFNTLDAWPTQMSAELPFSGPLDETSISALTLRVFQVTNDGIRDVDLEPHGEPEHAPTKALLPPPEGGWTRGRTYFAAAIGGPGGLLGAAGEPVVADAAFWFLRVESSLLDHIDALPGDTREEKKESAEQLEEIRLEIAPYFDHLKKLGIQRRDVVSLWSFTITSAPEIVMDKESGRMPLPSDFLLNPATGLVDLPIHDEDTELEASIKRDLGSTDGFGLSSDLIFETSTAINPATLTSTSVMLFAVTSTGSLTAINVSLSTKLADTSVTIRLEDGPLTPDTDHAVVITSGLKDHTGRSVRPMLPGLLAMLDAEIYDGKASTIATVDHESAAKVEPVRKKARRVIEAFRNTFTSSIAAVWPVHTMSIRANMEAARDAAALHDLLADPVDIEEQSTVAAALDFPISALTLLRVRKVFKGAIFTADYMDPFTRKKREDGYELRKVGFTMTIPVGHDENDPLPVVIFGHGLMAERRFVLAIGDALAGQGLAAISIDFPYHGTRTHCVWAGPQCVVNPLGQNGDLICPDPCSRNTSCSPDGRCVDSNGEGNDLSNWPIVGFPQASGGAFVDVDNMVGTRDHFFQSVTDLSALKRSLQEGDWRAAIGYDIDPKIGYIGQSLGGIMGALLTAVHPDIERAVLNVPGSDVIDLFRESQMFAPHLEAFLDREQIVRGSAEHERFLNIGRWLLDAVDPQNFAPYLQRRNFHTEAPFEEPRTMLIQMALLDFIIPNNSTLLLERLSGVPREDYVGEHAFIVIPIEPAYIRGTLDAARLLGRGELP